MSDPLMPPQPEQGKQASYKAGGGLVVQPLPDEIGVPVRRYQFDILCEGGIGEAKASRDLYTGICVTALIGFVGTLVAIDWETILAAQHRAKLILALVSMGLLFAAVAVSAAGICIHEARRKRTLIDSPFAREKARLLRLYAQEAASAIPAQGDNVPTE
jgi:hypothetical protein